MQKDLTLKIEVAGQKWWLKGEPEFTRSGASMTTEVLLDDGIGFVVSFKEMEISAHPDMLVPKELE